MDLEFTGEQEELRAAVRSFLAQQCPMSLVRSVAEDTTASTHDARARLWRSMVELDWPALALPEDVGGMGLGFAEVAVVAEELGAAVAPVPYLETVTQFVPAVREAGSSDQIRRFLGAVVGAGSTGALAVADDPRRWDAASVSATATETDGGWVLTGTKNAVMAGLDVDELVVAARVGKLGDAGRDRGTALGLFVVPGSAVTVVPTRSVDATRSVADVIVDGVVVPSDRVLGIPGSASVARALGRALDEATVALALETVGTCQALFDLVVTHAKERHQFGAPIGSFQAVKHTLADSYVELQRARALAYHAVAAIAEDDPARVTAVPMAKAASDDCQRRVTAESIQILGGIAFTWEHDAHLYVKRALASGALFGKAADHRLAVARELGVMSAARASR